jgi:hypothetical protein
MDSPTSGSLVTPCDVVLRMSALPNAFMAEGALKARIAKLEAINAKLEAELVEVRANSKMDGYEMLKDEYREYIARLEADLDALRAKVNAPASILRMRKPLDEQPPWWLTL